MEIETLYRNYIHCINQRDWKRLGDFVREDVHHNGRLLGVEGYRAMLERDYQLIPDLHFTIQLLVTGQQHIACRLFFSVSPCGDFLGLPVNGRRIHFCEHAFYTWRDNRIENVWSVIDKSAIENQLG